MISNLKDINLKCNKFSVYDSNALTINELLCDFFTKINECVDVSNQGINILNWLKEQGLPNEVLTHLEKWLNDGTLENIINDGIFTDLNNKIKDNANKTLSLTNNLKNLCEPQVFIMPHHSKTNNSDMSIIKSHDGKFHMIDCGDSECDFSFYKDKLDKLGVDKLENLFITHFHSDHVGQATEIIRRYQPKRVYGRTVDFNRLPEIEVSWETKKHYDKVRDEIARQGVEFIELSDTSYILNDKEIIKCLGSDYVNYSAYNHMSVAFLYEYNNTFKMYFAGDTTEQTEQHIMSNHNIGKVDVLKVGHHGWGGSTSEDFAWALSPTMSIVGNASFLFNANNMGNVPQHLYYTESKIFDSTGTNNGISINIHKNGYSTNAKEFHFPPLWFDGKNGKTYYFNENGVCVRDTYVTYKGRTLYINKSYTLVKNSFIDLGNNDKMYANSNGYLIREDWWQIDGAWYYFDATHYAIRNKSNYFIKGKYYNFDNDGVCLNP